MLDKGNEIVISRVEFSRSSRGPNCYPVRDPLSCAQASCSGMEAPPSMGLSISALFFSLDQKLGWEKRPRLDRAVSYLVGFLTKEKFKLFFGLGSRAGGGLYFIPKMSREPNPKESLKSRHLMS